MKTPFTLDQFLEIFKQYNETVFPSQIFLLILALWIVYLAFRRKKISDKWINGILAFF